MITLALPVLIPLLAGAVLLLITSPLARSLVAFIAAVATLYFDISIFMGTLQGDVLVLQMANWPAPWGISLVADRLTGIMLALSGLVGLLTVLFASSSLNFSPRRGRSDKLNKLRGTVRRSSAVPVSVYGRQHVVFNRRPVLTYSLLSRSCSLPLTALLILGNELPQLREGFKYVVINLVSSAIFVVAAGFAYGLFGTLNMADIALRVSAHGPDPRITLVCGLLALVFATKSALFPLGFWLPNTYPVPAAAVSAFFAAILTKVGAYTLIRTFTLMFPSQYELQFVLLVLAGFTIVWWAQSARLRGRAGGTRSPLPMLPVSATWVMGVFIGTAAGLSAALYYLIHSVLLIFTLFLIAALAEKINGLSYRSSYGHLSLYPWLGVGFFHLRLGASRVAAGQAGLLASTRLSQHF